MTEKMHNNLQEKYKNGVFQILKIWEAFSNFNFKEENTLGCAIVWK